MFRRAPVPARANQDVVAPPRNSRIVPAARIKAVTRTRGFILRKVNVRQDEPTSSAKVDGHPLPEGYELRPGSNADLPSIRSFVLNEKMNPLGLEPARFTIACVAAPTIATTGPNSSSSCSRIAAIVQTLPLLEGPPGAEQGPGPGPVKLQSLVVAPEHRGKGLGSALVRHRLSALPPGTPVWLTAVERGAAFYQRLGFRLRGLGEVPRELWFEVAAGTAVARLAVNQRLVVMSTTTATTTTTTTTTVGAAAASTSATNTGAPPAAAADRDAAAASKSL
ncbi:hypothetical protein PLESTB_000549300 [Pleodorina starrii]|uniref:N-acetyltransferase domain-containing protein n=1 Tax=Pleodorina starrii TaxID=330485 RepID=A0A9W6F0Y3_9CHLO|nr:hypothetical protein PLESTB_000549300 [Pleodorina starrii]GLC69509.1 hypothetical protein PLESTF_000839900 [Pleodorina starrii]